MIYTADYDSPIGKILLASREGCLIGLWINNQPNYLAKLADEITENPNGMALIEAKTWLDQYFQGKKPGTQGLKLRPIGSDFRQAVWKILRAIPYGQTMAYGEIAHRIAEQRGLAKMSAQAVGGAVGSNPISIIIPCHRVIGTDGGLTGYASGLDIKIKLLQLEQASLNSLKSQNPHKELDRIASLLYNRKIGVIFALEPKIVLSQGGNYGKSYVSRKPEGLRTEF